MALSASEIQTIHLRRLATYNIKYYGDSEKVYVGTRDGRLRLLPKSKLTTFNKTKNIDEDNVQDAIEKNYELISDLEIVVDNNFTVTNNLIEAEIKKAKCFAITMAASL